MDSSSDEAGLIDISSVVVSINVEDEHVGGELLVLADLDDVSDLNLVPR